MLSRTDLVTWVLGAVAKPIETRVPKLLEKRSKRSKRYQRSQQRGNIVCTKYKER